MNGLDEKDVAILKALQENADVTNRELAAKVHLSPTPVFERVKRLREQGYIKKVAAVLDTDKLDCSFVAFCFIKLKQHTFENAKAFFENAKALMDAVQDLGEVGECYNISGDYDFLMKVYVSSMKEYQRFVLRILGDLDCIGGLNSFFVMGEVKAGSGVPVRVVK